jgi:alkanesulfonate monooxygenase SsuD/methylene tetrahydromethanopterin reductase-like flavin-dependent oxidoreductase (luciferase family)
VRRRIQSQVAAAAALSPDLTWSDIVDRGYVIAGSPETVIDRLKETVDTLRVGHLMVLCHFGDMPEDTVRYNSERFMRDVAPKLRDTYSEWEDRWWPKPALVP